MATCRLERGRRIFPAWSVEIYWEKRKEWAQKRCCMWNHARAPGRTYRVLGRLLLNWGCRYTYTGKAHGHSNQSMREATHTALVTIQTH